MNKARAIWGTARYCLHMTVLRELVLGLRRVKSVCQLSSTLCAITRSRGSSSNSSGRGTSISSGEEICGSDMVVGKRDVWEASGVLLAGGCGRGRPFRAAVLRHDMVCHTKFMKLRYFSSCFGGTRHFVLTERPACVKASRFAQAA